MSRRRTIRCMAIGAALVVSAVAMPAVPAVASERAATPSSSSQSVIEASTTTVGPYGAIALVGDSLMVGSAREGAGWGPSLVQRLTERGWGPVRVRAGVGFQTGRTLPSTSPANLGAWLHQQRLAGFDPAVVVVNLGTNDITTCRGSSACAFANIRHLLDIIGPDRQVWWSQIVVANQEHQQTWNEALRTVAAQRPNLVLWDWPTAQAVEEVPMAADGIHLQGAGAYRQRSVLMADDITTRLGVPRSDGAIPAAPLPVATAPSTWVDTTAIAVTTAPPSVPTTTVPPTTLAPAPTTTTTPVATSTTTTTTTTSVPEPYVQPLPDAGDALAYRAIEPRRLLDTRTAAARVGPGVVRVVDVADEIADEIADRGAIEAVAVNVASIDAAGPGYLTVWPCGSQRPETSAVNTERGTVRSAQVLSALGRDGELCIWSSVGTDLVVDLQGMFVPDAGDRLDPLLPTRVLDTRQSGRKRLLTLAAPSGASAVAMTITVTGGARPGFLTAYGCTAELPLASTVNWGAGETVAGATFAPVGADGLICLATSSEADVIVDVTGAFRPEGRLGFRPVPPTRMIDTRDGAGGQVGPLDARRAFSAVAAPATAGAVSGMLTIVAPRRAGYLTATVCGTPAGQTSTVNAPAAQVRTSGITVALSAGGTLCMHAHTPTDAVLDVTGWWTP